MNINSVLEALAKSGFFCLATAKPGSEDKYIANAKSQTVLLIGTVGSDEDGVQTSRFWDCFCASSEYSDGHKNPMDRWTHRIVSEAVERFACGVTVLFPFEGPPWVPFVSWALQSGTGFYKSPLGMAIHQRYGLWCGFRAALVISDSEFIKLDSPLCPNAIDVGSPCLECQDKPCLTHCPVSAFSEYGYDAVGCRNHLDTVGQSCTTRGCQARLACPIGKPPPIEQRQFHISAFSRSR